MEKTHGRFKAAHQIEGRQYNSVVLKTGIGYSYRASAIFAFIFSAAPLAALIVAGVPLELLARDFTFWLFPILIMFLTFIMRTTIDQFTYMFNLFEQGLNDSARRLMRIFSSQNDFDRYRRNVRRIVFSPKELILGVLGALTVGVGLLLIVWPLYPFEWQLNPSGGFGFVGYFNSWTTIAGFIALTLDSIAWLFIGAGMWMIFGIIRSIGLLGAVQSTHKETLGSLSNPKGLIGRGKVNLPEEVRNLFVLGRSVRQIGVFMYRFCLKLVVVGLIIIAQAIFHDMIFLPSGSISTLNLYLSIIMMFVVFSVFVIPQLSIHRVLVKAKNAVLSDLDSCYEDKYIEFIDKTYSARKSEGKNSNVTNALTIMSRMIDHVKEMGTWSFSRPVAIKVMAAASTPFLTALLDVIITRWLLLSITA